MGLNVDPHPLLIGDLELSNTSLGTRRLHLVPSAGGGLGRVTGTRFMEPLSLISLISTFVLIMLITAWSNYYWFVASSYFNLILVTQAYVVNNGSNQF